MSEVVERSAEVMALNEVKTLVSTLAENHEARIRVLEKKMDRRTAAISGLVSVVVAVATHLMGCVPAQGEHPTPQEYRDTRDAVVQLHLKDANGDRYGTGFWVSPELIVTAGHVCQGQVTVVDLNLPGTVLSASTEDGKDACVLRVQGHPVHPVLQFSAEMPSSGDHVWYVGFPDTQLGAFQGLYLGQDATGDERLSFPAYHGASGSPVLNDQSQVIGVVVAVDPNFTSNVYATSLAQLVAVLKESK